MDNTQNTFDFGQILGYLKQGFKVTRKGWNGEFILLVEGTKDIKPYHGTPYASVTSMIGTETISILPHIDMYKPQGNMLCGWVPTQIDILATDWETVNDEQGKSDE